MEENNPYQASDYKIPEKVLSDEDKSILASRALRLAAFAIDTGFQIIIIVIAFIMIFLPFYTELLTNSETLLESDAFLGHFLISGIVVLTLYLALAAIQIIFLAKSRQTIGKKILGLKIVRSDLSECGFWRALFLHIFLMDLISNILTPFCYIGTLLWIIDKLFIFRSSAKCLHNDIADTLVVHNSSFEKNRAP